MYEGLIHALRLVLCWTFEWVIGWDAGQVHCCKQRTYPCTFKPAWFGDQLTTTPHTTGHLHGLPHTTQLSPCAHSPPLTHVTQLEQAAAVRREAEAEREAAHLIRNKAGMMAAATLQAAASAVGLGASSASSAVRVRHTSSGGGGVGEAAPDVQLSSQQQKPSSGGGTSGEVSGAAGSSISISGGGNGGGGGGGSGGSTGGSTGVTGVSGGHNSAGWLGFAGGIPQAAFRGGSFAAPSVLGRMFARGTSSGSRSGTCAAPQAPHTQPLQHHLPPLQPAPSQGSMQTPASGLDAALQTSMSLPLHVNSSTGLLAHVAHAPSLVHGQQVHGDDVAASTAALSAGAGASGSVHSNSGQQQQQQPPQPPQQAAAAVFTITDNSPERQAVGLDLVSGLQTAVSEPPVSGLRPLGLADLMGLPQDGSHLPGGRDVDRTLPKAPYRSAATHRGGCCALAMQSPGEIHAGHPRGCVVLLWINWTDLFGCTMHPG